MAKRSADTFACHESIPEGATPFYVPVKRQRSKFVCRAAPPSPSDQLAAEHAFSSSSDEMSDVSDIDQNGAVVVADHLAGGAPGTNPPAWAPSPLNGELLGTLGLLTPPACSEARHFLEQLVCTMCEGQLGGSTSSGLCRTPVLPNLGTALWHAFAELNTALGRHFSELPTSMLRGYHSFVRAPRAALWARFAASQGAQGQEAIFGTPGCGPCQALLLRFLLEHLLGGFPDASVVVYTIEVPAWLRGWCARWGHPGHGPLRVLALFAYGHTVVTTGGGAPAAPRVLYIPCE